MVRPGKDDTASFGYADVEAAAKGGLVRGIFHAVSPRYDLMNDLMSGGVHRLWKDAAAARLNPQPGETIIDCAGGTGDMAARLVKMGSSAARRRGGKGARVLVVDATPAMIEHGRARTGGDVMWAAGDAEALPLADATTDAYCIAFGLRNVTDIAKALAEARRVLKVGGRFLCLEFSRPTSEAVRLAYDAYSFAVIPKIGAAVARNAAAYRYLIESIRRFPDRQRLSEMMGAAGFARISATGLGGGVCVLHQGWVI